MKKLLFLFLILNFVRVFPQLDSLQMKRRDEIVKNFEAKCTKDRNRAIDDSKKTIIYYVNIPAPDGQEFLQEKEFAEILKPYGITFGGSWMGSDIAGYYTSNSCYHSSMTKFAEVKFGESFFEGKINEALKIFIINNPDRVFDYRRESLKFAENNFEVDFWRKFKLPKNYIKSKNKEDSSKVDAFFTIDKDGKAENVDLEPYFKNKSNTKFEKQILSAIKNKIIKYHWKPNTYEGFPVKSLQSISITFP